MSYLIEAKIVCDGCGKSIKGEPDCRLTHADKPARWAARLAREARWLFVGRGRWRTERHYCAWCADHATMPDGKNPRRKAVKP